MSSVDRKKLIIALIAGNILEWYDFLLYGAFATIFARLFFSPAQQASGLVTIFGVFAVGFLMRPVGGILYGAIGDRLGRKVALLLTILMMAVPTVLLGCLPIYASIGVWASFLFILLRMLQGLSVGGELPGIMISLVENAPQRHRAFISSLMISSTCIGLLLGSFIVLILSHVFSAEKLDMIGWRIAYFIGAFIGAIAFILRFKLMQTVDISKKENQPHPLIYTFKNLKIKFLKVILIQFIPAVGFQLIFIFPITLFSHYLSWPLKIAVLLNAISLILFIIVTPLFGKLSDRIGRKLLLRTGAILLFFLSYPLYIGLTTQSKTIVVIALLLLTLIMALYYGGISAATVEIFTTPLRYTPIGVAHSLVFAFVGGTALLAGAGLIHWTHHLASPAFYLMLAGLVSFIGVYWLTETYLDELII